MMLLHILHKYPPWQRTPLAGRGTFTASGPPPDTLCCGPPQPYKERGSG